MSTPMPLAPQDLELEAIEIELLLEGVQRHRGHDLRSFARPALVRAVRRFAHEERLASVSAVQAAVLHDDAMFRSFLRSVAPSPPGLFEEPGFWRTFREQVAPALRTWPSIRAWVAGGAAGGDAASLAVVLLEEGLLRRTRIYATDADEERVEEGRRGRFTVDAAVRRAHADSGGSVELDGLFHQEEGRAAFGPALREHLFFAPHNLATDGSPNEFHVVLCRDVLLQFNRTLHNRVQALLNESVVRLGVLGLGRRESLRLTPNAGAYEPVCAEQRLFRRVA